MKIDISDFEYQVKNLDYWRSNEIFDYIINQNNQLIGLNTKDSCKICGSNNKVQQYKNTGDYYCNKHYKMMYRHGEIRPGYNKPNNINILEDCAEIITTDKEGNETGRFKIDHEDIIKIIKYKWHKTGNNYCMSNVDNYLLHRIIMDAEKDDVVDHIDRNTFDNRKFNLRLTNKQKNCFNSNIYKNNASGIIGVSFNNEKNKWKSYITINNKQKSLGYYDDINEATIARLVAEYQYFGSFSPQRHLFKQYGIDIINDKEEMNDKHSKEFTPNLFYAIEHYKRMCKLTNTPIGAAHDQALTGIIVQFDLTFSNKAWVELQRYHFIDFVSSQSTMHRISKFDLSNQYNEYVDKRIIVIMEELKDTYNRTQNKDDYLKLLYSNPAGFQLTARMTTNYRQLKTMRSQRKNHRLPEWREFCRWVETLPMFEELCLKKGN
jgi:hypothetical protein